LFIEKRVAATVIFWVHFIRQIDRGKHFLGVNQFHCGVLLQPSSLFHHSRYPHTLSALHLCVTWAVAFTSFHVLCERNLCHTSDIASWL